MLAGSRVSPLGGSPGMTAGGMARVTENSREPAFVDIRGVGIEMIDRGRGRPLLFLHPGIGVDPAAPVLDLLAKTMRVLAPSHPGFGRSDLPRAFTTVDDLAYFYLDLLDALDLRDVVVVGVSLGGWIAAEVAVKSTARIARLVLADTVGIRISEDPEVSDIADTFAMPEQEFVALAYHDPAKGMRDPAWPDEKLIAQARNLEATARFAWSPYMHDPKLKGRLHRIGVPTLILWGAQDRIVTPGYGRAYAAAIPGARFATIDRAGHFPHIEQPDDFARHVLSFVTAN
jgi:pimeloyl-ACP methyl ester carboxylesterase